MAFRLDIKPQILSDIATVPLGLAIPDSSSFVLISEAYFGYWGHRTVLWRISEDRQVVRHRLCVGPGDFNLGAMPPSLEELEKSAP